MTAADSQPDLPTRATGGKWLFRGVLITFATVLLLPLLSVAIYGWRVNQQRALLEAVKESPWDTYMAPPDLEEQPWFVQWLGEDWAMPRAEQIMLMKPFDPGAKDKLDAICELALVDSLELSGGAIDDRDLSSIARLKSLRSLDLSATDITDAGLRPLLQLPRLDDLDLSATEISDEALTTIAQLKALTTLRLRNTSVSQAAVDKLRQLRPELEIAYVPIASQLQLSVVREIFKRGGKVFAPEGEPTAMLSISGAPDFGKWDGFDWSQVHVIPQLEAVYLTTVQQLDDVLAGLGDIEQLRTIYVDKSPLSPKSMELLGELDQLESVSLLEDTIPGEWAQEIRKLKNLKDLSLENARIGRAEVAAIATLGKLHSLAIRDSVFEPNSLESLEHAPAMERVDFRWCNLTDRFVQHIARCQNVRNLSLNGNRGITDQSIDILLSMPALENADVGETGFTAGGEQRLVESLQERESSR